MMELRTAQKALNLSRFQPVLFDAQVSRRWADSKAWLPSKLSEHAPSLIVKRSNDNRFMYTEDGRLDLLRDSEVSTEVVEMKSRLFFESCARQKSTSGPFHYFTARVEEAFPKVAADGWEELVVDRFGGSFSSRQLGYLSVWLGGPSSTTQAHYDVMNNCFVQVYLLAHAKV